MTVPIRVLFVEDSEDDVLLLLRELRRSGYTPLHHRVDTALTFTQALAEQTWDLIIADYSLPQFSGLAALKLVNERQLDLPFLIISGIIDEQIAVEAMKNGAHDYLMKDNLKRLAPAVERELREAAVRWQQRAAEAELTARQAFLREANATLLQLAQSQNIQEGRLAQAFVEVTEVTAQLLKVERVSIWLFTPDQTKFRCQDLYEQRTQKHSQGDELNRVDYPCYFQALEEHRCVAAHDARTDPRTAEYTHNYLIPLGITSMLDMAVRLHGQMVGTICLEHIGLPRQWLTEEEVFAGSLADTVALALGAYERQQANEALRHSEEQYRDLFENANDVMYTQDLQGKFLAVNKKAEQLTGYLRTEAVDLQITQLIAPEYLELIKANIAKKLNGEADQTIYEVEIICKDGRRVPVEVNSRLLYEDGCPVGIQGIARDISERKLLEEQLRQAQKMEAIGRLAGAVAHDFNNLLTAILGYSQLLLRRLGSGEAMRKELVEIEKAGQRAAALTNQLLTFSRKQVFEPQVLNLNPIVTDIEQMLRRLIGEDIDLAVALAPELGRVKADRGQLEQVIMNLAVNSRDAMPQGGTLTIATANVEIKSVVGEIKPGAYVTLTVSDTGIGMDRETQARIFEPFFTTKEAGKGTGLGLATVYGIVKQSGGSIECISEVGKGTLFRIYLPQIQESIFAPQPTRRPEPNYTGHETVLLVEDDEAVRELTRHMLELNGYAVIEARDAQEALMLCHQQTTPIPLLITDVVMPQVNGRVLAQRISSLWPTTKVLLISGYTDNHLLPQNGAERPFPLLQKPFTPEALLGKVRALLDGV